MKKRLMPVLGLLLVVSCGGDTELANGEKPQEKMEQEILPAPAAAPGLEAVLARVPEEKALFKTAAFDQNGTYVELDTLFVRKYALVKDGYVFEMPESWQAVVKMYYKDLVLLVVSYTNPSANNLELFVFDANGQQVCTLPLALNMFTDGQVPVEATINPEGLVSVLYKDQRQQVRKDFQLEPDGFKLVKTVNIPG